MDYVNSEATQKADLFLPTTTLYEAEGVYVNQEGRAQAVRPAYRGGTPITQTGEGDHPPRIYDAQIPGADPLAAWQILAHLTDIEQQQSAEDLQADIGQWLVENESGFKTLPGVAQMPPEGTRFHPMTQSPARFVPVHVNSDITDDGQLEVLAVERTFGTEELCAYSVCLQELAEAPCLCMHSTDARLLNLDDGDRLVVELNGGAIEARLQVVGNMASGILIIPRHPDLGWQKMNTGRTWVRKKQIGKLG
jgi:NADH-quinone oxidoreductase subunit G